MILRIRKISNPGFTLLEIMLALTIFALVLTAVYSSWIGILKASKIGAEAAADVQRSRIALQTIEDSLTCARSFAADVRHYSFIGENGDDASLSFVARLPERFPRSGEFGDFDVRRVTFTLERGKDSDSQLVLRQNPILRDVSEVEQEHPLVLARNVKKFEIEFWDTVKKDWTDEWTQTNQLPLMVKVKLEFNAGKNNSSANSYSVTRVVGLPSLMVAQSWQVPTAGRAGAPGIRPIVQPVGSGGGGIIIPVPGAPR